MVSHSSQLVSLVASKLNEADGVGTCAILPSKIYLERERKRRNESKEGENKF